MYFARIKLKILYKFLERQLREPRKIQKELMDRKSQLIIFLIQIFSCKLMYLLSCLFRLFWQFYLMSALNIAAKAKLNFYWKRGMFAEP